MSEQKIEQFYRPATADDVARVMRGETVEARFRDGEDKEWACDILSGWEKPEIFIDGDFKGHLNCQVYDPPEWFLNKPDPGEGWRLLGKFPDEPITGTDDYWSTAKAKWMPIVKLTTNKQREKSWFRRRIANNPEIPDSCKETPIPSSSHLGQIIEVRNYEDADWQRAELEAVFPHTEFAFAARVERNTRDFPTNWRYGRLVQADLNSSESPNSSRSRDDIPSGWRLLGKDEERLASDAYWSLGAKDWVIIGDNRVAIANMLPRGRDIRQVDHQADYTLLVGFTYPLPNGQTIRVTEKGFEVV